MTAAAATSPADVLGPAMAADEVSVMRLRRELDLTFGPIAHLEAHLALLDSRGVRYAAMAARSWNGHPAHFFGVVRHVVRTQADGPAPVPDVEGWLAAGRPDDPDLGPTWDQLYIDRYCTDVPENRARCPVTDPAVAHLDTVLRAWPAPIGTFTQAYGLVERVIELTGMPLPPLTA